MRTPRIIFSLLVVLGAAGAIASGATGAFFSDTETSTGNTFVAGAFHLKIDNDSYYNGNRCVNISTDPQAPNWQWQGSAIFPIPGSSCVTSFPKSDLEGHVFFAFNDLKPDDEGEDTISIHVENDAWACMDLTLASNDDNSSNEPELETGDAQDDNNNAWDGELAQNLQFFWWADDGDNVYEDGEQPLTKTGGVQSLYELASSTGPFSVVLADASDNAWGLPNGTPIPGGQTVYIAKAWCLGTMTLDPVEAGQGDNPSVDPGVDCDGTQLGNGTQTDGVELNVTFRAEQARNNGRFLCSPPVQAETVTIALNKIITADTEGIGVEDFELHIDGPIPGNSDDIIVGDNAPVAGLPAGTYHLYEVILNANLPPGVTFTSTFGGACDSNGDVTVLPGQSVVCTLTNVENI